LEITLETAGEGLKYFGTPQDLDLFCEYAAWWCVISALFRFSLGSGWIPSFLLGFLFELGVGYN
jgi:hypothetical protein